MWRDRIIKAKTEKGITIKYMADFAGVSENTVRRALKEGSKSMPMLTTIILLGKSVGIDDIFADTDLRVCDAETAENMKARIDELQAKVDDLEMKLAMETAMHDAFKTMFTEQIIALHKYYNGEEFICQSQKSKEK